MVKVSQLFGLRVVRADRGADRTLSKVALSTAARSSARALRDDFERVFGGELRHATRRHADAHVPVPVTTALSSNEMPR